MKRSGQVVVDEIIKIRIAAIPYLPTTCVQIPRTDWREFGCSLLTTGGLKVQSMPCVVICGDLWEV